MTDYLAKSNHDYIQTSTRSYFLRLTMYQDILAYLSSSIDQNEWCGKKALSAKQRRAKCKLTKLKLISVLDILC